jgi:hypothetical protein
MVRPAVIQPAGNSDLSGVPTHADTALMGDQADDVVSLFCKLTNDCLNLKTVLLSQHSCPGGWECPTHLQLWWGFEKSDFPWCFSLDIALCLESSLLQSCQECLIFTASVSRQLFLHPGPCVDMSYDTVPRCILTHTIGLSQLERTSFISPLPKRSQEMCCPAEHSQRSEYTKLPYSLTAGEPREHGDWRLVLFRTHISPSITARLNIHTI